MSNQQLGPRQQSWVQGLRAWSKGQTSGHLRDGGGYCCLGVMCDLFPGPSGWTWRVMAPGGVYGTVIYGFGTREADSRTGYPPLEVAGYYGITQSGMRGLAEMNDTPGMTFDKIADFIEANPEKIFEEVK